MPEQNSKIFMGIQKYPAHNGKITVPGIQQKIIRHEKQQENTTHNKTKIHQLKLTQ